MVSVKCTIVVLYTIKNILFGQILAVVTIILILIVYITFNLLSIYWIKMGFSVNFGTCINHKLSNIARILSF
ncbi:hypothetical protein SAMN05192574_103680 [Mucilaginibacter gossypiicola]|uniref:Uncharacterized protein n=1 Tax=Mucilaginibacter gossypiicola TaxID=551995 RepID=A0A1H8I048_9SPHI|nr:hypothetical protein SAMN05192574_103680 [Mucilaginibacter gossypiicola]